MMTAKVDNGGSMLGNQEKEDWLQFQEFLKQSRVVNVYEGVSFTSNLYFGTRRTTNCDVMSTVTTSAPIPRIRENEKDISFASAPVLAVADKESLRKPKPSKAQAAKANTVESLSRTKHVTMSICPLREVRNSKLHERMQLIVALKHERDCFISALRQEQQRRISTEMKAATTIQQIIKGYLLRKRFWTVRNKLRLRKRVRMSLRKVMKGATLVMGQKGRRKRVREAKGIAAIKVQTAFRRWSAEIYVAKERHIQEIEYRDQCVRRVQRQVRKSIARVCVSNLRVRKREELKLSLARFVSKIRAGYQDRQKVRRIHVQRGLEACRRIQSLCRQYLARKVFRQYIVRRHQQLRLRACVLIQRLIRGYLRRAEVLRLRSREAKIIVEASVLFIQRMVRAFLGRRRSKYYHIFYQHDQAWKIATHLNRIVRGFLARRLCQIERLLQEEDLLAQTRLGNLSAVMDLLDGYGIVDEPVDITVTSSKAQNNVLHIAAKFGQNEIVTYVLPKILSEYPSMVYAYNKHGKTAVYLAIEHNNEDIALYMLTKSSQLFVESTLRSDQVEGNTRKRRLILHAARHGASNVVEKLFLLFPDVYTGSEVDSWTKRTLLHEPLSLMRSISKRELETEQKQREERLIRTMKTVLEAAPQCDIDAQDIVGFTPLHYACEVGCPSAVRLLLSKDVNAFVEDTNHRMPWQIALRCKSQSCLNELRLAHPKDDAKKPNNTLKKSSIYGDNDIPTTGEDTERQSTPSHLKSQGAQGIYPQLDEKLLQVCYEGNLEKVMLYIEEFGCSVNCMDTTRSNDSLLHIACRVKELAIVKYLMSFSDLNIEHINAQNVDALSIALDVPEIAEYLIYHGDIDYSRPYAGSSRSVCHEAVRRGYDLRKWLDWSFADALERMFVIDMEQRTPLHDAAIGSQNATGQMLINIGVNVNVQDRMNHRTALHEACRAGNSHIVGRIMDVSPGTVSLRDNDGRSPFFDAVSSKSIYCVDLLQPQERNGHLMKYTYTETISNQADNDGWTLLHEAVQHEEEDMKPMVIHLLHGCGEKGVKATTKAEHLTPLHVAAKHGNVWGMELLLQANARVDRVKNRDGETAMQYAAKFGRVEAVQWMLDTHPVKRSKKQTSKTTLLHYTAYCLGHQDESHVQSAVELVNLLIDRQPTSLTAFDDLGYQPLHVASGNSPDYQIVSEAVVRALISRGAPLTEKSKSKTRETPVEVALRSGPSRLPCQLSIPLTT